MKTTTLFLATASLLLSPTRAQTGQDCYANEVTNKNSCNYWCNAGNAEFGGEGSGSTWNSITCTCPGGTKSCTGQYVTPTCSEAGLTSCDFDGSTCAALCTKWVDNGEATSCNDNPSSAVTCKCGSFFVCQDTATIPPIPVQNCYEDGVGVTNQAACDYWCGPDGTNTFGGQGSGDRWLGVRCQCFDWDGKLKKACEGSFATPDCQTAGMYDCSFDGSTCDALCTKWINTNEGTTCSPNPNLYCKCGDFHVCKPADFEDCESPSIAVSGSGSCNTWCGGEGTYYSFATPDIPAGFACGCLDSNDAIIKACVSGSTKAPEKEETAEDTTEDTTEEEEVDEATDEPEEVEEPEEESSATRRGQAVMVTAVATLVAGRCNIL